MKSLRFAALAFALSTAALAQDIATVRQSFQTPPDDARIMMRWWWFGSAVEKPELEREMRAMKQGGIGGFEIQPVYALALDDPAKNFRNLPYLSDGFLEALSFTNSKAHELGLRVDLTLASGWPYGGSYVPVTQASGRLRVVNTPVPEDATSIAAPSIANGEQLIAAFLSDGKTTQQLDATSGLRQPIPSEPKRPGDLKGQHPVEFFISSRTGQQVKRPAVGADGFVLDHFDRAAVDNHLTTVADHLMAAFGKQPPYAVFSDSLEVYGADWTPNFLAEFKQRRGYDLTPYLPELVAAPAARGERRTPAPFDEKTADVRHDYGQTLTDLINENYLTNINTWATQHGTRFRSQTYGDPAVTMSSNALVALPEGEGPQWRSFSYTRWATSASHAYHRPITSAETWTWLHSPAFRATPLDMKAEADLFFLEGINQLIGHGWPYTPASVSEPGWAFYAAAVFNDHNPWYFAMPSVAKYLQRTSYMLRQGEPANDVALLLPNDDAWARFSTSENSISGIMPALLGTNITPQILDAGFNLDYIDATAIGAVGIQHPVLILPGVERIPLATYQKIAAFAKAGGVLIATRSLPSRAPGVKTPESDSAQVKTLSHELFQIPNAPGHFITDEAQLGATLARLTKPDMALLPATPEVGFIHRKLKDSDIYFIANTSNQLRHVTAAFRVSENNAEIWNPFTAKSSTVADARNITLDLAPYDSRFIVFSNDKAPAPPSHTTAHAAPASLDLASGWTVTIPGSPTSQPATTKLEKLHSWADNEATRYYSGTATYTRIIDVPASMLQPGLEVDIDFGPGTPIDPSGEKPGTRPYAYLASPVREAAQIFVNGKEAGTVWHPPYTLDVTALLHAGRNDLKIIVGNTAINTLAGRTLPDYKLLNIRYGERFTPQDMNNLEPLPSGILGPIKLTAKPSAE